METKMLCKKTHL